MRAESSQDLWDELADKNPEAVRFRNPDYSTAIVGLAQNEYGNTIAVYDGEGCIEWLMRHHELDHDAASEFFILNTLRGLTYTLKEHRPVVLSTSAFATVDAFKALADRTLALQQYVDDATEERRHKDARTNKAIDEAHQLVKDANVALEYERKKAEQVADKLSEILYRYLSPEDVQKALIELAEIEEGH